MPLRKTELFDDSIQSAILFILYVEMSFKTLLCNSEYVVSVVLVYFSQGRNFWFDFISLVYDLYIAFFLHNDANHYKKPALSGI